MSAAFDKALAITLEFEGGYANVPGDHGGATNFGITQKVYDEYRTGNGMIPQPVKNISSEEVHNIYYVNYWEDYNCDKLPDPLNIAVFDTCVNAGSRGIKMLQNLLGVEADGQWGRRSAAALEPFTISQQKILDVTKLYLARRANFYQSLVARDPSQRKFLKGWMNRVNALREKLLV